MTEIVLPDEKSSLKARDQSLPDLRPNFAREQGWDVWRPVRHLDPPEPPSMARRQAEEQAMEMAAVMGHGRQDGKARKIRPRRTVDLGGSIPRWTLMRNMKTAPDQRFFARPTVDFLIELLPPRAYGDNPSTSVLTKYVHTSTNKIRCPINVVRYTPDARRVLTGATSGEFTLWNGLTFNFETILQAHDSAVRAVDWSHSGVWLVSGDNNGVIKYFQQNMNNLQIFEGHKDSIRDVSFAPNDARFVTGGDDGDIKIWSFEERREEKTLKGHGWDVKCVKWHPTKGLLCSGGKDSLVKFWDPRSSKCLTTLHGHKNSVQACSWNPGGNTIATASRDSLIKVFDIRMMKELVSLRGHKKEVCSLAWHPIHHDVLASGGSDGSILHWILPDSSPVDSLDFAHDSNVWSLDFHPLGHVLCSGSNDHTTRFWSRGRPGVDISNDRFHIGKERAKELGQEDEEERMDDFFVPGLSQQIERGGPGGGRGGRGVFPRGGGAGRGGGDRDEARDGDRDHFRPPPPRQESSTPLAIPGFGRTNADTFDTFSASTRSAPDHGMSAAGGRRRGPLPSQQAAMGRDLSGGGGPSLGGGLGGGGGGGRPPRGGRGGPPHYGDRDRGGGGRGGHEFGRGGPPANGFGPPPGFVSRDQGAYMAGGPPPGFAARDVGRGGPPRRQGGPTPGSWPQPQTNVDEFGREIHR